MDAGQDAVNAYIKQVNAASAPPPPPPPPSPSPAPDPAGVFFSPGLGTTPGSVTAPPVEAIPITLPPPPPPPPVAPPVVAPPIIQPPPPPPPPPPVFDARPVISPFNTTQNYADLMSRGEILPGAVTTVVSPASFVTPYSQAIQKAISARPVTEAGPVQRINPFINQYLSAAQSNPLVYTQGIGALGQGQEQGSGASPFAGAALGSESTLSQQEADYGNVFTNPISQAAKNFQINPLVLRANELQSLVPTADRFLTPLQRALGMTGYAQGGVASLGQGGYPRRTGQINGPGTETSDSIPAMLSDGEFVMTARAVRGAGNGDRRKGAKRMYALMHQLERNASKG